MPFITGPESPGMTAAPLDLLTVTGTELQRLLSNGDVTSEYLVDACMDQIQEQNNNGLKLNAMISVADRDRIRDVAKTLDTERQHGKIRSALHGIPITVKVRLLRIGTYFQLLIEGIGQHHDRPRPTASNDCWHICFERLHG